MKFKMPEYKEYYVDFNLEYIVHDDVSVMILYFLAEGGSSILTNTSSFSTCKEDHNIILSEAVPVNRSAWLQTRFRLIGSYF